QARHHARMRQRVEDQPLAHRGGEQQAPERERGVTQKARTPAARDHRAAARSAASAGLRLSGLSRLNERASPRSRVMNAAIDSTARATAGVALPNVACTIDCDSTSYCQTPTRRPR